MNLKILEKKVNHILNEDNNENIILDYIKNQNGDVSKLYVDKLKNAIEVFNRNYKYARTN